MYFDLFEIGLIRDLINYKINNSSCSNTLLNYYNYMISKIDHFEENYFKGN